MTNIKKEHKQEAYFELNENKFEVVEEYLDESVKLHFHDYLEAELVLDGEATQYIDDFKTHLKRGSFSILRPNIDCHSLEINNMSVIKFYAKPFVIEEELWKEISLLPSPLLIELEGDELNHVINMFNFILFEQRKNEKYNDVIVKNIMNSLLDLFVQVKIRTDSESAITNRKNVIAYLLDNDNYLTDVSLQEFADDFGYSLSHASKYFKNNTGMSFSEAKQYFRIQNAKRLLLSTDYSINEIATMCGFNYYHLFHNLFKKSTGMTPFEFKKNNRQ